MVQAQKYVRNSRLMSGGKDEWQCKEILLASNTITRTIKEKGFDPVESHSTKSEPR